MEEWQKILLIVGIVLGVLLVLALVIVILFFRSRAVKRRQISDLEKERDYLQTLLSGKVAKNIARIELISRTNLLYVEVLGEVQKAFRPLLVSLNTDLKTQIETLQNRIKIKEYSGLKKEIVKSKSNLVDTKTKVLSLETQIDEIVKPEEETRTSALYVKEELREIKKVLAAHEKELALVSGTFKDLIENVNSHFTKIDSLIERAEYVEANNSIREMAALFKELRMIVEDLPQTCVLLTEVLPAKMKEVNQTYLDMENQQFPLRHLRVLQALDEMEIEIKAITEKVIRLETRNVYKTVSAFNTQLEDFKTSFTKERVCRSEFDRIYQPTATIVEGLHKRFIKLSKNLHEVRKYYSISEEFENKLEEIKMQIDDITSVKRNLDTYIHSASGPHYSLLLTKTKQLKEKADECERNFASFQDYESSLKNDAEKSFDLINTMFFKLFEVKRKIRNLISENIRDNYSLQVKKCYAQLNLLSEAIKSTPIDMDRVNAITSKVLAIFDELNANVERDIKYQKACEQNFVNANIYRAQFNEVNRQMVLIENAIKEGQLQLAYKELASILAKHNSTYVTIEEIR